MDDSRIYFLDTTCLVKLYILEDDSFALAASAATAKELVVCAIAELEFLSAIGRRAKDGEMTARQYEQLLTAFQEDWSSTFVQQPVNGIVYDNARILLRNYRLRTLDALQLASAIAYSTFTKSSIRFLTADFSLAQVAQHEGFLCGIP
jgi:predicted nucleic acid-binding protein